MRVWLLVLGIFLVLGCKRSDVLLSSAAQADSDDQKIRDYLTSKNITGYTRTVNGTYVVIDSAHPENPYIRNGQFAFVKYRGYFPGTEATSFDSITADTVLPFRVEVGRTGVINGWQEGLRLMRSGEYGRFFIPSGQGYGTRGSSDGKIPPNQNLIFNIHVIKVE